MKNRSFRDVRSCRAIEIYSTVLLVFWTLLIIFIFLYDSKTVQEDSVRLQNVHINNVI